jgi:hypothetical protein
MRSMAKGAGEQLAKVSTMQPLPNGRPRDPRDSNGDFVLAFADALRDILREERRRAA